ncbi:hypothetical protein HYH03_006709 [Edaphochlamys debaryana]|uniref:Protein kinase domain-containing protein n=1 Tax=Edaphochlamys debaryana TaxID=47281 RepID=A0A835Y5I2_9CHLO|nr:hypothetical protein HYH03_006709 [Edaphochlamys debaryana]|eukprot:KAG2495098.1 hypothetical protein HYH03_006709 [Edaphochlamys debaryana]
MTNLDALDLRTPDMCGPALERKSCGVSAGPLCGTCRTAEASATAASDAARTPQIDIASDAASDSGASGNSASSDAGGSGSSDAGGSGRGEPGSLPSCSSLATGRGGMHSRADGDASQTCSAPSCMSGTTGPTAGPQALPRTSTAPAAAGAEAAPSAASPGPPTSTAPAPDPHDPAAPSSQPHHHQPHNHERQARAALALAGPDDACLAPTPSLARMPPPPPSGWSLARRPAVLRLRCIVRDPCTSSMLATATGHVDDPSLPLRRTRGGPLVAPPPQPPPAAGAGGSDPATSPRGDGLGSGPAAMPGSLLLIEEQVLGRGAFGFVTLCVDAVTQKNLYALKRMRKAAVSLRHVMQEQAALRLLAQDVPEPEEEDEPEPSAHGEDGAYGAASPASRCRSCGRDAASNADAASEARSSAPGGSTGTSRSSSVTGMPAPAQPNVASGYSSSAAGGGRCAAAAAAAASGRPLLRPCACRFCTAAAAGVRKGAAGAAGGGGGGGPGGGATMGPARAAWLAKQQARGWLPPPLPRLPSHAGEAQRGPGLGPGQGQGQGQGLQAGPSRRSLSIAPSEPKPVRCSRRGHASFCVRQLGTFQDDNYLYLLQEYCPGGDLDRLVRRMARKTLVPRRAWIAQVVLGPQVVWRGLPEAAARFYAAGIVLAIQELHARCIIYRDLKPGNVLIDEHGYPCLADFGMAKVLDGPRGRSTSPCGTLDYMAPEVVKIECEALAREGRAQGLENWAESHPAAAAAAERKRRAGGAAPGAAAGGGGGGRFPTGSYGMEVDWWSFGCVLYVLLTGCKPFLPPEAEAAGEDAARMLVRIINPRYEVPMPLYLSPMAQDLVRRLLVRQPRWRLGGAPGDAEDVRAHPFFRGFDWDAYQRREMRPPYPMQEEALPQDMEVASVANFFFPTSLASRHGPADGGVAAAAEAAAAGGQEHHGATDLRREAAARLRAQHEAAALLKEF